MAFSESQARLTQSEPAKWIVVYKNGDQHCAGRRMVVRPREIRTFDHLLEEVTVKLSPSFGAVRNIFTPEGGTRVSSLTDLKPNGQYVASPNEPFRQLSRTRYSDIPVQSTSHSRVSLQPVNDKVAAAVRRPNPVPSRYRAVGSDELTIHVYRNGDAFSAASPLRVDRLARSHWEQTLARLGEKLRIGRGVHKLYNLRGQLVRDPATDLEHNGQYVAAADNEGFRLVNYGASREPFLSVTRGDSRTSTPHPPCAHQRVAESAPSPGAIPPTPRLAAHKASSSSRGPAEGARRAPFPPLRVSYPELAGRCKQLKDKCAVRGEKRREDEQQAATENGRKHRSLHGPPPSVRPQLPRPPPRGVTVAPIDVAPGVSDDEDTGSAFSSNTDLEDGSVLNVVYPETSQPELEPGRPPPFYLHPVMEAGEEAAELRRYEDLWEIPWDGAGGPETVVYIVTEPLTARPGDLGGSYSAPQLSAPPSPDRSEAGTPLPSAVRLALSQLARPAGSGFYSPGYSPLPEASGLAETPRTPPLGAVPSVDRWPSCELAVGGGSRPASRAVSEPRLASRLSLQTPEPSAPSLCQMALFLDGGGYRCVSVASRASSVPEVVSPVTPDARRPLLARLMPRRLLCAPVSRGESPVSAVISAGSETPVSARSDPDVQQSPPASSLERMWGWPARPTQSPPAADAASAEELPVSPDDSESPVAEYRSNSAASRSSSVPEMASCQSSPTPDAARPLLTRLVPRGLLCAPVSRGESPEVISSGSVSPVSVHSDSDGQGSPTVPSPPAASAEEPVSPPAVSVERMWGWPARPAHSPHSPASPPSVSAEEPASPPAASAEELQASLDESRSHVAEHQSNSEASRASSVPEVSSHHSPVTLNARRPLLSRLLPRGFFCGPTSRRESAPAVVSSGSVAPASVYSAAVLQQSPPVFSPQAASVEKMWGWPGRPTHSPPAVSAEELPARLASPALSPSAAPAERLSASLDESGSPVAEHQSNSAASRASSEPDAASRRSVVTPDEQQLLLSRLLPQGLLRAPTSRGDSAVPMVISSVSVAPAAAQSAFSVPQSPPVASPPAASANELPASPPAAPEERFWGWPTRPTPSPRRRTVYEGPQPPPRLSRAAAAGGGWDWDEIPARSADRAAPTEPPELAELTEAPPELTELTVAPPPAAQVAPPERRGQKATAEPRKTADEPRTIQTEPQHGAAYRQQYPLPPTDPTDRPVWPPTRTNTPEEAATPGPELEPELEPEQGPETEPGLEPEPEQGPEPEPEPAAAAVPADISQKLDEIATLLRTLLLQSLASGRQGAAPAAGLTEEQVWALLQPKADTGDSAATGDSAPHKPQSPPRR